MTITMAMANADATKIETDEFNKITETNSQTTISEITVSQAYKLLYENSKESNDRIISTIQWVLGIVFAFLLALIGSQIFFNFRISKKEIDNIKKDIDKKISELKVVLLKDIDTTNRENTKQFQELIEKIKTDVKENINYKFEEKSKLLDVKIEMHEKGIGILKHEFEDDIKYLKVDINKNKGDLWNLKGVKSNALTSFITTASLIIELKREVKYILNDIIEVLEKLNKIHEMDYSALEILITKIPKEHSKIKSKIEILFKDKPVYKYIDGSGQLQYVKNEP